MFDVTHNPFVYGEVVPAPAFVDRVAELDRLVQDLAAAQKVFLISPRRYGKSSLIRRALAAMERRGALTVEVTVSSFSSYVAFLEGYARALVTAETKWDRARTWLRGAISSTRIDVGADPRVPPPQGFGEARQSAKRDGGGPAGHMGPALQIVRNAIISCQQCPRLRTYCTEVARTKRREAAMIVLR